MLFEFWKLHEHVNHRRHEDGLPDALAFDRLAEDLWVELRYRHLASAKSRRREDDREIGDVKHRSRVKIHATFYVGHPVVEVMYIGQNFRVSQYGALRTPSCTARVDESQNGFGVVNRIRVGIALNIEGLLIENQLP